MTRLYSPNYYSRLRPLYKSSEVYDSVSSVTTKNKYFSALEFIFCLRAEAIKGRFQIPQQEKLYTSGYKG